MFPQNHHAVKTLLCAFAFILGSKSCVLAGPPFITDDPEPVEYHHWEVYVASQASHDADGWLGTAPHFEINYGVLPNTQLHMLTPIAYNKPVGGATQYGIGDIELGIKYRFVEESSSKPQIGIFPLIEIPAGNRARGLGSGNTPFYLPVWFQKSWDAWTTYGGGGYWRNPGANNRDYWFSGWQIQRAISKRLAVGGELFHTTARTDDGRNSFGMNIGFIYDISEQRHILFSIGDDLRGPSRGTIYAAYQWTFGPQTPTKDP